ncbi:MULTISPECIES: acyl carrier protein [Arsukibacterium]|jgi:acyl carrier protein|uniref:Acyl carrier protein n=1 Tax=Arsukibacterium indicum TaxID=2848612 RepID=A0ABS6MFZ2_9GAMM|nr:MULTISPECIES: phosphopantetheine-binding protein [Arsukibacterium]MBV2127719.1 acyl carrier protein [Arsukibacterium indicum]MDX1538478.1 phosphopantetheine-binding protein [Arsukibacterium sp.]
MPNQQLLADILRTVLQIDKDFSADTPLLGAIPEFDSMAIIAVITELEDQLGIEFDDDEISAEIFETFGQLSAFVAEKQAA